MLDAAKKLKFLKYLLYAMVLVTAELVMHIDPEWVDKIEPMDPGSMELFMLERSDNYDEQRSRLCSNGHL